MDGSPVRFDSVRANPSIIELAARPYLGRWPPKSAHDRKNPILP
jgi:hypothetical protein